MTCQDRVQSSEGLPVGVYLYVCAYDVRDVSREGFLNYSGLVIPISLCVCVQICAFRFLFVSSFWRLHAYVFALSFFLLNENIVGVGSSLLQLNCGGLPRKFRRCHYCSYGGYAWLHRHLCISFFLRVCPFVRFIVYLYVCLYVYACVHTRVSVFVCARLRTYQCISANAHMSALLCISMHVYQPLWTMFSVFWDKSSTHILPLLSVYIFLHLWLVCVLSVPVRWFFHVRAYIVLFHLFVSVVLSYCVFMHSCCAFVLFWMMHAQRIVYVFFFVLSLPLFPFQFLSLCTCPSCTNYLLKTIYERGVCKYMHA